MISTDLRPVGFYEMRERITGNRLEVYARLLDNGPATGSELAAAMGWPVTSVRPRLTELLDLLHAEPTGKRRNSEHEFRALTASQAQAAHAAAFPPPPVQEPAPIGQAGFSFA
jgi:hypothetical protein